MTIDWTILNTWWNNLCWWLSKGSGAEWVSVMGSFGAIAFAYIQICEQKHEYEDDKKSRSKTREILNRPLFTVAFTTGVKVGVHNCYYNAEKFNENYKLKYYSIINGEEANFLVPLQAISITNITEKPAINVIFKISFSNNTTEIFNCICIQEKCRANFFTRELFFDRTSVGLSWIFVKKLELYFDAIDGKHYYQVWDKRIGTVKILDTSNYKICKITDDEYANGMLKNRATTIQGSI